MNSAPCLGWLTAELFVERLGWLLVHSLWQFSLVAFAAAGLLAACQRRSSAVRHGVLTAAFVVVAVLPFVTALVSRSPSLEASVARGGQADGPRGPRREESPSSRTRSESVQRANVEFSGADAERTSGLVVEPAPGTFGADGARREALPTRERVDGESASQEGTADRGLTASGAWRERLRNSLQPWLRWIVGAWSLGVLVWSLRPLLGWHMLWRLRRVGTRPASESVVAATRRISARLGLSRAVQVCESTLAQVPLVVGYVRPLVLLPVSLAANLPTSQLEALLAHELAHVRRHDFALNLLQTLAETLFFYHPATWWLSRRLRIERENCCDDLVVEQLGNRVEYGRALLAVEEHCGAGTVLALGVNDGSLLARVRRITGVETAAQGGRWRATWFVGVSLACVGATLTGLFAQSTAPPVVATSAPLSSSLIASTDTATRATDRREDNALAAEPSSPTKGAATDRANAGKTSPVVRPAAVANSDAVVAPVAPPETDWPMWGGSPKRNHVSRGRLPSTWAFQENKNVVWRREIGTQTYSSPIVSGGKIFIGTNNEAGLDSRRPRDKDLSCLVCLDQATGQLSWLYASEKLDVGRKHDWPSIGLCSTACVQGDRIWVVTNRCEVVCLDVNGFRDGENDGEYMGEVERTERDADIVWKFDMFQTLGVRPLHQAVSSITVVDGVVLLNTSNGVDESRQVVPAPHAPNFLALDARTGKVVWQDNSAGDAIIVGGSACGCSGTSPAVGRIGGVMQAIFAGREGWLHAYDFADLRIGKTTKLWQFDCNPKKAEYSLGQKSERNTLVASPVIVGDRVFIATGRNPEEGEGPGDLWCIDATKRGDISSELVFNPAHRDGQEPIPFKTRCACDPQVGDFVRPNPNSGAVWRYVGADLDGDGKLEFVETFHRSVCSPVVQEGLAFIADFSGILHCVDASTGRGQWTLDLFDATWSNCVAAGDKVLVADEGGDVTIVRAARKLEVLGDAAARNLNQPVFGTPALVGDTLFVPTKNSLVALREPAPEPQPRQPELPKDAPQGDAKPSDAKPGERKVSLDADRLPLQTALERLAAQARLKTEFDVPALAAAGLDLNRPVTLKFNDVPLDEALNRLIPWLRFAGAYRELSDEKLILTTIEATQRRTRERLPDWMKSSYGAGLLATLDQDGQVVSVTSSRIMTDELLDKLATLPRLRELWIEATDQLTPAGLAHLARLKSLERLSLVGIRFEQRGLGDDALRHVAALPALVNLQLNECGVTDAGAKSLEQLPRLTELSLGNEGLMTDAALTSVAKLVQLKSLELSSSVATEQLGRARFTLAGVRKLGALKQLETLRLAGHEVAADTLDFPKLKSLSLGDDSVDDRVAARIAELRELRELALSYCSFGDDGMARLATLPELTRLDVSSTKLSDAGIERLRGHRRLTHVSLRAGRLTDASLRHLAQIPSLARIDLSSTSRPGIAASDQYSISGLLEFRRLSNLRTLYLSGLDLTGIAGLKELKQLNQVSLMMCRVMDSELESLEEALPDVQLTHATGGGSWVPKRLRAGGGLGGEAPAM